MVSQNSNYQQILSQGLQLMQRGQLQDALNIANQLRKSFAKLPHTWFFNSQVNYRLGEIETAFKAIQKAIKIDASNPHFHLQHIQILIQLNRPVEALNLTNKMTSNLGNNLSLINEIANILISLKQFNKALNLYQKLAQLKPDFPGFYFNIATTYRSLGKLELALENVNKAIELNPNDFEAIQFRSSLFKQTDDSNHIEDLNKLIKQHASNPAAQIHLGFALGKEYEDLNNHGESFKYYSHGATARKNTLQYKLDNEIQYIEKLINQFPGNTDLVNNKSANQNDQAIFVLGLPRTGSTLIESMMSSHSDVTSIGETHFLLECLTSRPVPNSGYYHTSLDDIPNNKQTGKCYLQKALPWCGKAKRFIDKQPMNSLYVGHLLQALPKAKVILVERHPVDTCYAIYKNLFADAYPYSYDIIDLANYMVAHQRLMNHWKALFPDQITVVNYEDVVQNQEEELKRLLAFCDLTWQEDVMSFQKKAAPSTTASASQIRDELYTSSIQRWRHLENELKPVIDIFKANQMIDEN